MKLDKDDLHESGTTKDGMESLKIIGLGMVIVGGSWLAYLAYTAIF